jgi:hypothetical protein
MVLVAPIMEQMLVLLGVHPIAMAQVFGVAAEVVVALMELVRFLGAGEGHLDKVEQRQGLLYTAATAALKVAELLPTELFPEVVEARLLLVALLVALVQMVT